MLTGQNLLERIQKSLGVPWQSQRPDGYSDGFLAGSPETEVIGVATMWTPSLDAMRRAVRARCNTIICLQSPFFSRGERAPQYWRSGAIPTKEQLENDAVCQAKRQFISKYNLVVLRFADNWLARPEDGQLKALAATLGWEKYHQPLKARMPEYDPRNVIFRLPATTLLGLSQHTKQRLNTPVVRVVGKKDSLCVNVALLHGLVLVPEIERVFGEGHVDAVVAGDAVEWEVVPYFEDLVAAKMASGLVLIGSEVSEEPGCGAMAKWIKSIVPEVPVEWIPTGQPFWRLGSSQGEGV